MIVMVVMIVIAAGLESVGDVIIRRRFGGLVEVVRGGVGLGGAGFDAGDELKPTRKSGCRT